MEPIKRTDLKKYPDIWPEVIQAFNEMIQEKWSGHRAIIKTKDVVQRIREIFSKQNKAIPTWEGLTEHNQLDVENLYREKGFKVAYDKPGYNENYDAFYTFE